MSADEKAGEARFEVFARRKAEAMLSNAELCRRTGLTVNTVKNYLAGKSVRETTVQHLHEALEAYVSEQNAIKVEPDETSTIPRVGESVDDPVWFETQALQALTRAVEQLDKAAKLRIDQSMSSDRTFLKHLSLKLRSLNAFLDPV
ncbi:hypothetical protein [Tateyamaria sp. SN6-1]|uniref:hypothetical protein n=1 Tax=Tateyamaria sp. SN6-1 TaxID=3092148 RepID=UPI0039F504D1